jgi:hypothetical protein
VTRRPLSRHGATNSKRTRVPFPAFVGGNVLIFVFVVFVGSSGGDRLLLGRALDDLQSEHNPRRDVSEILDLGAVVGLALDRSIMGDPCVDEGPPDAIPTNHGLVGLEMAAGDERPHAVLVDVGDKVVDQHPTVLLRRHAVWLLRWLTRPPDGIPNVVEAVARHAHRAKVVGGEVLRGGAAALPEVAASSTKIDAADQHTHANPPEQLLAGHLLLLRADQPLVGEIQYERQLRRRHHV